MRPAYRSFSRAISARKAGNLSFGAVQDSPGIGLWTLRPKLERPAAIAPRTISSQLARPSSKRLCAWRFWRIIAFSPA